MIPLLAYDIHMRTDQKECGDDDELRDCIAQLSQREGATEEGILFGKTLRIFLRSQWRPLIRRFEEHVVEQARDREHQAALDEQRDKTLNEIKGILLDPSEGIVRRQNDEAAEKLGKKHVVAIVTTVVAVGAAMLTMLWHLISIVQKIAGGP